MAPKAKYVEGEKILCYHGPVLYEAKVQQISKDSKEILYRVHYQGWNKNWDEWVDEDRIERLNEQGLQKQKELKKTHGKRGFPVAMGSSPATTTPSGKKKGRGAPTVATPPMADSKTSATSTKTPSEKDSLSRSSTPSSEKPSSKQSSNEKPSSKQSSNEKSSSKQSSNEKTSSKQSSNEKSSSKQSSNEKPSSKQSTHEKSSSKQSTHEKTSHKHKSANEPTTEGPRRKKPKVEPTPPPAPVPPMETEEQYTPKIEVNIKLPEQLKPVLVDDWDLVNRQKMLIQLPAEKNIDTILNDYFEAKVARDKSSRDTIMEITKGIRDYFNAMLGTQLLYKFERTQYGDLLKDHKGEQLTVLYGSIHLLRLFVKIGHMLAYTALDDKSTSVLITHVQDFLRWMSKNHSHLFDPATDYYSAPADYHRKALL